MSHTHPNSTHVFRRCYLDLLSNLAELLLQNQAEAQLLTMPLAAFAAGVPPGQAGSVWTGPCPQLQHRAAQLWSQEAAWLKRAAQLWPQPAAEVGLAQSQVASHQGLLSWSALHMQLFSIPKRLFEFRNVIPTLEIYTQRLLETVTTRFYNCDDVSALQDAETSS